MSTEKKQEHLEIKTGHKHDGGTGITNFSPEQAEVYREAIRLHGDPSLVVAEFDFTDPCYAGHFSLHDLNPERHPISDLSPFWDVFDLVGSLYTNRKLFGVEHTGARQWVRYRDQAASLPKVVELLRASYGILVTINSGMEPSHSDMTTTIAETRALLASLQNK